MIPFLNLKLNAGPPKGVLRIAVMSICDRGAWDGDLRLRDRIQWRCGPIFAGDQRAYTNTRPRGLPHEPEQSWWVSCSHGLQGLPASARWPSWNSSSRWIPCNGKCTYFAGRPWLRHRFYIKLVAFLALL